MSLNLSRNYGIQCKELWEIVIQCQVNELDLSSNDISEDGLKQFKQLLMQKQYRVSTTVSHLIINFLNKNKVNFMLHFISSIMAGLLFINIIVYRYKNQIK